MKKKPVTIDDLAVMVQKGFAHTDEQFAKVHEQFTQVNEQFAHVDQQFVQVHHELRSIRKELEGVVYRPEFEALQDQVRDMEHVLSALKRKAA